MDGRNDLYIIGKSVACSKIIDDAEKAVHKLLFYVWGIGAICSLLFANANVIVGLLDGKKLSQIESPPLWQLLLGMGAMVICIFSGYTLLKKSGPVIAKYRKYCAAESLVLGSEKINGSTVTGSIQLTYEQISKVIITSTTYNLNNGTIGNDILEIVDIVGNVFSFHSFSNCRELKNIIDMQINKGR